MNLKKPTQIALVLLLIAVLPMPYGYYMLVRIYICIFSAFVAYKASVEKLNGWMWTFIIIAILFNPIIPIYLMKGLWAIIDVITAMLIFFAIDFTIKDKE